MVSGTLAGLAVTPDNYRTRAQVSYAIRFNLVNPVGSGDGVQIQLPEAIEVVRMPLSCRPALINFGHPVAGLPLSVVGGNVARGDIVKYE